MDKIREYPNTNINLYKLVTETCFVMSHLKTKQEEHLEGDSRVMIKIDLIWDKELWTVLIKTLGLEK